MNLKRIHRGNTVRHIDWFYPVALAVSIGGTALLIWAMAQGVQ